MSKRTHFTTVTSLPAGISRETVLNTLHAHTEMIDLNPLVTERHPIRPPPSASPEEAHCQWYQISDKVNYLPGVYTGSVTFNACFHDLPDGLQSHIYAPMGLNMKGRWTLGGSLPGEPRQPVEIGFGVPKSGLWLREDVDMKCNVVMTGFVKKTTKRAHQTLVDRLVEKAHLKEAEGYNRTLKEQQAFGTQYSSDYENGNMANSPVSNQFHDSKSQMRHTPSVSDAGSIHSGAGSNPRHSYVSAHDPRQSFGYAQVPIEHQYQHYQTPPTATYGGQMQPRPGDAVPNSSYPVPAPLNPRHHAAPLNPQAHPAPLNPPYPVSQGPTSFTAELASQEAMTPIELDSSHQRSPPGVAK